LAPTSAWRILGGMSDSQKTIERHRTALQRVDLSRPMKRAISDGLITPSVTVFDYGCGRGKDLQMLETQGVACSGWDPTFRTAAERAPADVVNLGFVLNVIEDLAERAEALRRSWDLARSILVVSAQVHVYSRGSTTVPYGDGVVTARGTFQKFFDQGELKAYIEGQLGIEAVPAEPGIFYVFRDEAAREQFVANRFRRRIATPGKTRSEQLYEENRELLDAFTEALAEYGRLPDPEEWPRTSEIDARFGSLNKAFGLVRRITGPEEWDQIAQRRREDLLVFLALARFRSRPAISQLPRTLQRDIKTFLGPYTKACTQADALLFRVGSADAIDAACRESSIGKLLPNALYVHRTALDYLAPLLRVYEGCGRAYLGDIEGANLVKIHRFSGKVSYLVYPDFELDPHPSLLRSVKLCMRTRQIDCQEYGQSPNPPVLHRKETFLPEGHELREKFARLTMQEERAGLLDDTATIGTREGWTTRLRMKGFALRGHRLVKMKSDQQMK
jgi:DNA phosphorothioation-associated putative methyltransferase